MEKNTFSLELGEKTRDWREICQNIAIILWSEWGGEVLLSELTVFCSEFIFLSNKMTLKSNLVVLI